MRPTQRFLSRLLVLGALLGCPAVRSVAAAELEGLVTDAGRLGSPDAGIRFVRVTVLDGKQKVLGEALTDPLGHYEFSQLPDGAAVVVNHDHERYDQRNTRRSLTLTGDHQPLHVLLRQRDGDRVYLTTLAAGLSQLTETKVLSEKSVASLLEGLQRDELSFVKQTIESLGDDPSARAQILQALHAGSASGAEGAAYPGAKFPSTGGAVWVHEPSGAAAAGAAEEVSADPEPPP